MTTADASRRSERYLPVDWPLPEINDVNRAFFTSGVLMLQRCTVCRTIQHPPLDICHRCQADTFAYEAASGRGTVDDVSIVHHAGDARLKAAVPYNVVIVSLVDHPDVRVVGNVVGADDDVEIGMPVRVTFAELRDEDADVTLLLPQWERAI
jgi:uncharacterized OB-fold protein